MPDLPHVEACKNTGPDAARWPTPLPDHDLEETGDAQR